MNIIKLKTGHHSQYKEKTKPGHLLDAKELILRSLFILCFLALSSCVSTKEYQKDWAPVKAAATECPDLTGDYDDESFKLAPMLAGSKKHIFYEHIFGSPHVTIAGPTNGKLHVTVWTGNTLDAERTFVQDEEFICNKGFLEFSDSGIDGGLNAAAITVGIGKGTQYWGRAEDDSLVTRGKGGGAGIVVSPYLFLIPLPVFVYGDTWEKFKPVYKPIEKKEITDGVKDGK